MKIETIKKNRIKISKALKKGRVKKAIKLIEKHFKLVGLRDELYSTNR